MYFSAELLSKLTDDYRTINKTYERLLIAYTQRRYSNERAKEYGTHGFPRRLKTITRCVHRVFELLPPESVEVPPATIITDATIYIQAFIFNIFGAIDNLAWVWVSEMKVTKENGAPLPSKWIGLGPDNAAVRATFSKEFQAYLTSIDPWFAHLADFRHALAHRIPLYIPPYVVPKSKLDAYQELEWLKSEAISRWDFEQNERLEAEQMKLVAFRPWMQHSFGEGAKPIIFHPQLLSDFKALDELAAKMLVELDAPRA